MSLPLTVDALAGCYPLLARIRRLSARLAAAPDHQGRDAAQLHRKRLRAIARLQQRCPHPLVLEARHDARRGPFRPLRICETCGLVESAWEFQRLVKSRMQLASHYHCRELHHQLLGMSLPTALVEADEQPGQIPGRTSLWSTME